MGLRAGKNGVREGEKVVSTPAFFLCWGGVWRGVCLHTFSTQPPSMVVCKSSRFMGSVWWGTELRL